LGCLAAPAQAEATQPLRQLLDQTDWLALEGLRQRLMAEAEAALAAAGAPVRTIQTHADLRYAGQGEAVEVLLPAGPLTVEQAPAIADRFTQAYSDRYGHTLPGAAIEWVGLRVRAIGPNRLGVEGAPTATPLPPAISAIPSRWRPAFFPEAGGWVSTAIFDRSTLAPGQTLMGPAIVQERESTTVLPPGSRAQVDPVGNLIITRAAG
jgi:N-methylhydantoinase A/oxoprolinase/acetone carboxylase beta subunit